MVGFLCLELENKKYVFDVRHGQRGEEGRGERVRGLLLQVGAQQEVHTHTRAHTNEANTRRSHQMKLEQIVTIVIVALVTNLLQNHITD